MIEREIKLRFATPEDARVAVLGLGARPLRQRRLQDDCLLDTIDSALRARQCALRVRADGEAHCVTWKGPPQPSAMKVREELEVGVADARDMMELFVKLGFRPAFRYQKYREEYAVDELVIAIDETPVGTFVELEGSESAIAAVASRLGRSKADYILESYRTLFLAWQERHGGTQADMVFHTT